MGLSFYVTWIIPILIKRSMLREVELHPEVASQSANSESNRLKSID